jgi:hypothetical protein
MSCTSSFLCRDCSVSDLGIPGASGAPAVAFATAPSTMSCTSSFLCRDCSVSDLGIAVFSAGGASDDVAGVSSTTFASSSGTLGSAIASRGRAAGGRSGVPIPNLEGAILGRPEMGIAKQQSKERDF